MRRPLLPSKLIPAADTVARLVAKTVLVDPDREDAEQLILLALWLERDEPKRVRNRTFYSWAGLSVLFWGTFCPVSTPVDNLWTAHV